VNEVLIIVVGAIVQGGVGFLFWVAGQRNVEKFDRISRELQELKDNRVKGIEENFKEHDKENDLRFEKGAEARKKIYEELKTLSDRYVPVARCTEAHKTLTEAINQFLAATSDMARAEERIEMMMAFLKEVNERLIAVKEDVDQHIGAGK